MKSNNVITSAPSAVRTTKRPMSKASGTALQNAAEAINIICELHSLANSPHYRKSYPVMVSAHIQLRALKKRLVTLMRTGVLGSVGVVPQAVINLENQLWDVWNWLKENRDESGMTSSILKLNRIPMNYEEAFNKHWSTIEKHRRSHRSNKKIYQLQVSEDHGYNCLFEVVFEMLYGYLPDGSEPVLYTSEFDDIVDDFRHVMGFDPRDGF